MDISVNYNKITCMYTFHIVVVVDGLDIHKEMTVTEEMVAEGGDKVLEYVIYGMLMDCMKLASEAAMPSAMLKTKGAIEQSKKESGGKAKPFTLSVKYGNTITNEWDTEKFGSDFHEGPLLLQEIGRYVDLDQKVKLPREVLLQFPDEPDTPMKLAYAIMTLNDVAKWTYNQIADWLEEQDLDISINLEGGE